MRFKMREDWRRGERHGGYNASEEMLRRCQYGGQQLDEKDLRQFVGGRFLFYHFGDARYSRLMGKTASVYRIFGTIETIEANFPVVDIDPEWQLRAPPMKVWRRDGDDHMVFVMRSWKYVDIQGVILLLGEDQGTGLYLIPTKSMVDARLENLPMNGRPA